MKHLKLFEEIMYDDFDGVDQKLFNFLMSAIDAGFVKMSIDSSSYNPSINNLIENVKDFEDNWKYSLLVYHKYLGYAGLKDEIKKEDLFVLKLDGLTLHHFLGFYKRLVQDAEQTLRKKAEDPIYMGKHYKLLHIIFPDFPEEIGLDRAERTGLFGMKTESLTPDMMWHKGMFKKYIYDDTNKRGLDKYKYLLSQCKTIKQLLEVINPTDADDYFMCFEDVADSYMRALERYLGESPEDISNSELFDYFMDFPLLRDNLRDEVYEYLMDLPNYDTATRESLCDEFLWKLNDEDDDMSEMAIDEFQEPYVINDWVNATVPYLRKFINQTPANYNKIVNQVPNNEYIYKNILKTLDPHIDKVVKRSSKGGLWDAKLKENMKYIKKFEKVDFVGKLIEDLLEPILDKYLGSFATADIGIDPVKGNEIFFEVIIMETYPSHIKLEPDEWNVVDKNYKIVPNKVDRLMTKLIVNTLKTELSDYIEDVEVQGKTYGSTYYEGTYDYICKIKQNISRADKSGLLSAKIK